MENNVSDINQGKIVIKNSHLNNFAFQQALNKLKITPFNVKVSYKISYICEHVDRHVKQGREIFSNLAKKFAKLDDSGNLVPEKDANDNPIPGSFLFKDDESKELFVKEQEEFMSVEHVIPKHKLSVSDLGEVKLSANEISALAPLFSDLE